MSESADVIIVGAGLADWLGTAAFDRPEDHWPCKWAEAYVAFAPGEKRAWLYAQGVRLFPIVGWAERGGHGAIGHGNSVPRFHLTWGTGPGVLEPFVGRVRDAVRFGLTARHPLDSVVDSAQIRKSRIAPRCGLSLTPTRVAQPDGRGDP